MGYIDGYTRKNAAPEANPILNVDLKEIEELTVKKARKIVAEFFVFRPFKEAGKPVFLPKEEWDHPEVPKMTPEARKELEHWLAVVGVGKRPEFFVTSSMRRN